MLKTQNYNLNKPELTDPVRVADFNENAEIIDAALKTLTTAVGAERIAMGSYAGNGVEERFLDLGCTPKFVLLFGQLESGGIIAFVGDDFSYYINSNGCFLSDSRITEGGINVKNKIANVSGKTNHYVLFL